MIPRGWRCGTLRHDTAAAIHTMAGVAVHAMAGALAKIAEVTAGG